MGSSRKPDAVETLLEWLVIIVSVILGAAVMGLLVTLFQIAFIRKADLG